MVLSASNSSKSAPAHLRSETSPTVPFAKPILASSRWKGQKKVLPTRYRSVWPAPSVEWLRFIPRKAHAYKTS